jgi:hypothetical protein
MLGKALRVAMVLYQQFKMLYMHATTPWAFDVPAFKLLIDPHAANREIPLPQDLLFITFPAAVAAVRTDCVFSPPELND